MQVYYKKIGRMCAIYFVILSSEAHFVLVNICEYAKFGMNIDALVFLLKLSF